MANETAVLEIRKILNYLDEDEVIKLTTTTTQNLLRQEVIKNKNDAIDVILRHSPDYQTILNRKVVKREYLFQYLDENRLTIPSPITKLALINNIINFWSKKNDKEKTTTTNEIIVAPTKPIDDINLMATKFTEWFYTIMNEDQPLGEEHFWPDCSLKLNLLSESANLSNSIENDRTGLVNMLFNTKQEHSLFFNPNLTSDGVCGKMDNHGLVMVFACGTLHTKECCVGVFEQMFALARDPFSDNNWKIKHTQMSLRSKDAVSDLPCLKDTDFSSSLQVYES